MLETYQLENRELLSLLCSPAEIICSAYQPEYWEGVEPGEPHPKRVELAEMVKTIMEHPSFDSAYFELKSL